MKPDFASAEDSLAARKIHPASPGAFRLGNRCRRVVTKAVSALVEIMSNGENPRRHASHNVIVNSTTVVATFGHEFRPHCPRHANCSDEENGAR